MREKGQDRRQKGDSSPAPTRPGSDFVMERFGSIRDMDRSFDIEYWQRQGDAAIFRAAWELVETYWRDRGLDPDELRIQRSVESFIPTTSSSARENDPRSIHRCFLTVPARRSRA